MDTFVERWKQNAFSNHPELWSFFDNSQDYNNQMPDDYNCQRWQDILTLAYIIHIHETNVVFWCDPGKMTQRYSASYRGHDSEEGIDLFDYSVRSVSKEDYDLARSQKEGGINTEWDLSAIERVFYIGDRVKEFLDDDYLVLKYHYGLGIKKIEIAATVKAMKGYYIFTFSR